MKKPSFVKKSVATLLGASLVTSAVAPVLAESAPGIIEKDTTKNISDVSDAKAGTPANLEEAQAELEKAKTALEAAEKVKNSAEATLNNKKADVSTATSNCNNAQKNLTNAQQASINAFANIVEKNNKNVSKQQEALKNAENEVNAAEKDKDAALKDYNNAVTEKTQAESKVTSANAEKDAKEKALADAKAEEKLAQDAYNQAKADYEKASDAYSAAKAKTDNAKFLYDNAETSYIDAQNAKQNADKALEDAQNSEKAAKEALSKIDENSSDYLIVKEKLRLATENLNEKVTAAEKAKLTLDAASSDLASAEATYNDVKASLAEKKTLLDTVSQTAQSFNTAQNNLEKKQTLVKQAEAEKNEAEQLVNNAESTLNEATNELNTANETKAEAKKALDEAIAQFEQEKAAAEKTLKDAQEAYANAGKDFLCKNLEGGVTYDSMFEGVLNNYHIKDAHLLDTEKDIAEFKEGLRHFLTVENLLKAAELSKCGNEKRALEGSPALKLDYNLMLFSAFCNSASLMAGDHIIETGAYDIARVPIGSGIGENLAWTGVNPYELWYDEEKAIKDNLDAKVAENPEYANTEEYKSLLGLTGHYHTLKNKSYIVTGITTNGYASEQIFTGAPAGKAVTPDEFISALNAYAQSFRDNKASAESRVESLKVDPEYLAAAKLAYNNAANVAEKLETKKAAATQALNNTNATLEKATTDLKNKTDDYNSYKNGEYSNLKKAKEDAERAFAVFDAANPNLESKEQKAKNNLLTASQTKTDAEKAYNAAVAENKKAQAEFDNAKKTLETKDEAIRKAKSKVELAEANTLIAQNTLDKAKDALEKTKSDMNEKKASYDTLKAIENGLMADTEVKRQEKNSKAMMLDVAKDSIEEAEVSLEEAKGKVASAETILANATAKMNKKNDAKLAAMETLSAKQDAVDEAEAKLAEAKALLEKAKLAKREDPSTYETLFPELIEIEANVKSAQSAVASAQAALQSAENAANTAKSAYDKAVSEYALAVADYNLALSYVDKYTVCDIETASGIKVTGVANKTYTGKAVTQKITVTRNGEPVTVKVSYPDGNTSVGTHTVSITGTGKYKGTLKFTYKINPKVVGKRTFKTAKTSIKVSYKKVSNVTGYDVSYRKKGTSKWITKSTTATTKMISSFKRKTTYEIRVRTYKTVGKAKYYSSWSSISKVKTK